MGLRSFLRNVYPGAVASADMLLRLGLGRPTVAGLFTDLSGYPLGD
jgi:hypothetical protein